MTSTLSVHFKITRFFLLFFFLISSLFIKLTSVNAQESLGIAISPPTFEISGNPGDIIKNSIRVENLNDVALTLSIDKRNFTAVGEAGAVGLTDENTTYSLASWLTTETSEITLQPKSSRSILFSITIPASAEPGGHFGSLLVKTVPNPTLSASGAVLTQELGSLILLRVAGEVKESAAIESFTTSRNVYEYGPVTFDTRFHNYGSVHIKPKGTIIISDILGRQVATLDLNSKNVLPDAIRQMDTEWPTKYGFGRYTATLVTTYGSQDQKLTKSTHFVILPYRLIGALALGIFLLALIIYRSRKRFFLATKVLLSGKT